MMMATLIGWLQNIKRKSEIQIRIVHLQKYSTELCIELNFSFVIPNYLYAFFGIEVNDLFDILGLIQSREFSLSHQR